MKKVIKNVTQEVVKITESGSFVVIRFLFYNERWVLKDNSVIVEREEEEEE